MKAIDLIEILSEHPFAEVCINEYTGGLTETLKVRNAKVFKKGDLVNKDGGETLNKDGSSNQNIILLTTNE